jgi:hypothetical protein
MWAILLQDIGKLGTRFAVGHKQAKRKEKMERFRGYPTNQDPSTLFEDQFFETICAKTDTPIWLFFRSFLLQILNLLLQLLDFLGQLMNCLRLPNRLSDQIVN